MRDDRPARDRRFSLTSILLLALAGALAPAVSAQDQTFKARLSSVPISADMAALITGSGSVTGTLSGHTLTLTGLFTGLQSPATLAHIHIGERTGVRGPVVFDVRVDRAPTGSMSATIELTDAQIVSLTRGFFYVQLHSEKAPDGNLWGWLLVPERQR